ncbi:MAG: hypothetical protein AABY93_10515 [Bacteroidota bacterium]
MNTTTGEQRPVTIWDDSFIVVHRPATVVYSTIYMKACLYGRQASVSNRIGSTRNKRPSARFSIGSIHVQKSSG